jgi:hypothetical protein
MSSTITILADPSGGWQTGGTTNNEPQQDGIIQSLPNSTGYYIIRPNKLYTGYPNNTGNVSCMWYSIANDTYTEVNVIEDPDGIASDFFGHSADLSDDGKILVIGKKTASTTSGNSGVHIYYSDGIGGAFVLVKTYDEPEDSIRGGLGTSVALTHNQGMATHIISCDNVNHKTLLIKIPVDNYDDESAYPVDGITIDSNGGITPYDSNGPIMTGIDPTTYEKWGISCTISNDGNCFSVGQPTEGVVGTDGSVWFYTSLDEWDIDDNNKTVELDDTRVIRVCLTATDNGNVSNYIDDPEFGIDTTANWSGSGSRLGANVSVMRSLTNITDYTFMVGASAYSAWTGAIVPVTISASTGKITSISHILSGSSSNDQMYVASPIDDEHFIASSVYGGNMYMYNYTAESGFTPVEINSDTTGLISSASFVGSNFGRDSQGYRNICQRDSDDGIILITPDISDGFTTQIVNVPADILDSGETFFTLLSNLYFLPPTSSESLRDAYGNYDAVTEFIDAVSAMASSITETETTAMFETALSATSTDLSGNGVDTDMKEVLKLMSQSILDASTFSRVSVSKDLIAQFFDLPNSILDDIAVCTAGESYVIDLDSESVYAPIEDGEFVIIKFPCDGTTITIKIAKDSSSIYTVIINDVDQDIIGSNQEGDTVVINYEIECNYKFTISFGSIVLGGVAVATAGGDPYITPIYGPQYKLPDRESCYRLFERGNVFINSAVKRVNEQKKQAIVDYAQSIYATRATTMNLTEASKLLSIDDLVLDGYFFDTFLIYSEQHVMYVDLQNKQFKTLKSSQEYFTIVHKKVKETGFGITNLYKNSTHTKVTINWTHSEFGKMYAHVSAYDNPQIDNGVTISKAMTTKDCVGLLMYNFKPKLMEIPNINTLTHKNLHRRLKNANNKYINKRILSKNETLISIGKNTVNTVNTHH